MNREKSIEDLDVKIEIYREQLSRFIFERKVYKFVCENRNKYFCPKNILLKFNLSPLNDSHYSDLDYIVKLFDTNLDKYFSYNYTPNNKQRMVEVKNVFWVSNDNVIKKFETGSVDKKIMRKYAVLNSMYSQDSFYLISMNDIPFYLLEEFGGKISDKQFFEFVNTLIKKYETFLRKLHELRRNMPRKKQEYW